jgi:hypothetical protein
MVGYAEAPHQCLKTMESRRGFQLAFGGKPEFEHSADERHRRPSRPENTWFVARLIGSERQQVSNERVRIIAQELWNQREIGRSLSPPASQGGSRLHEIYENSLYILWGFLPESAVSYSAKRDFSLPNARSPLLSHSLRPRLPVHTGSTDPITASRKGKQPANRLHSSPARRRQIAHCRPPLKADLARPSSGREQHLGGIKKIAGRMAHKIYSIQGIQIAVRISFGNAQARAPASTPWVSPIRSSSVFRTLCSRPEPETERSPAIAGHAACSIIQGFPLRALFSLCRET